MTAVSKPFRATAQSAILPARIVQRLIAAMDRIPYWLIALSARSFPAALFWQSGQTKVAGFSLKPSAIALFENEYQLPLIYPEIAAYVSAVAEHLFPVLLVIGLASRFSALALLVMTTVIEVFVYPQAWPTHIQWAAMLLVLLCRGPGRFSVDQAIWNRVRPR